MRGAGQVNFDHFDLEFGKRQGQIWEVEGLGRKDEGRGSLLASLS